MSSKITMVHILGIFNITIREVGMAQFKCKLSSNMRHDHLIYDALIWDSEEASVKNESLWD